MNGSKNMAVPAAPRGRNTLRSEDPCFDGSTRDSQSADKDDRASYSSSAKVDRRSLSLRKLVPIQDCNVRNVSLAILVFVCCLLTGCNETPGAVTEEIPTQSISINESKPDDELGSARLAILPREGEYTSNGSATYDVSVNGVFVGSATITSETRLVVSRKGADRAEVATTFERIDVTKNDDGIAGQLALGFKARSEHTTSKETVDRFGKVLKSDNPALVDMQVPDRAIAVGESWEGKEAEGSNTFVIKYRLLAIETLEGVRCAKIHKSEKSIKTGNLTVTIETEFDFWLDLETGMNVKMEGKMTNESPEATVVLKVSETTRKR